MGAREHQGPSGERDCEQRPVAEPQESTVASGGCKNGHAGEGASDEDHGAEDVKEEGCVPAVGANRGEHLYSSLGTTRVPTRNTSAAAAKPPPLGIFARPESA